MTDMAEKIKAFRKIVKDNISYELAVYNFGEEWTDGIVELMVDVICLDSDYVRINKRDFPLEIVRERFLKISYAHIENVYFTTRKTKSDISNIREYLITVIYRSYETADNWMVAKANYDLST